MLINLIVGVSEKASCWTGAYRGVVSARVMDLTSSMLIGADFYPLTPFPKHPQDKIFLFLRQWVHESYVSPLEYV